MLTAWFSNIAEISLSCSVPLLFLFVLAKPVHRKYTAKWLYWVYFVIALRLLIPWNLTLSNPPMQFYAPSQTVLYEREAALREEAPFQQETEQITSSPIEDETEVSSAAQPEIQPEKETVVSGTPSVSRPEMSSSQTGRQTSFVLTLLDAAAVVWLLAAVFRLVWSSYQYWRVKKTILRWSRPVEDVSAQQEYHRLCQMEGITNPPDLLLCPRVASPMVLGAWRPVIVLPQQDYGESSLQAILRHELIHYKRKDVWYKLILAAAAELHWFNPLVRWMMTDANRCIEYSCDDEVVRGQDMAFRKAYSEAILSVIHRGNVAQPVLSTSFQSSKEALKQRFQNIFDTAAKRKGYAALGMVLLAVLGGGAFVSCTSQEEKITYSPQVIALAENTIRNYNASVGGYPIEDMSQGNLDVIDEYGYYSILPYLDLEDEAYTYQVYDDFFEDNVIYTTIPKQMVLELEELTLAGGDYFWQTDLDPNRQHGQFNERIPEGTEIVIESIQQEPSKEDLAMRVKRSVRGVSLPDQIYEFQVVTLEETPQTPELTQQYQAGQEIPLLKGVTCDQWDRADRNGVVKISTEEELRQLSDLVNGGDRSYGIYTFQLAADIEMSPELFSPIGGRNSSEDYPKYAFLGVFDGAGHTISGMRVNETMNAGMFGVLGLNSRVENLNLQDISVEGQFSVGGLAGRSGGSIRNVSVEGRVEGLMNVGGLVGVDELLSYDDKAAHPEQILTIENCRVDAQISGCRLVGGLVGELFSTRLTDCETHGTIILEKQVPTSYLWERLLADEEYGYGDGYAHPSNVGGMVGRNHERILRCHAGMTIQSLDDARLIGQFVGSNGWQDGWIEDCTYATDVGSAWDPYQGVQPASEDIYNWPVDVRPVEGEERPSSSDPFSQERQEMYYLAYLSQLGDLAWYSWEDITQAKVDDVVTYLMRLSEEPYINLEDFVKFEGNEIPHETLYFGNEGWIPDEEWLKTSSRYNPQTDGYDLTGYRHLLEREQVENLTAQQDGQWLTISYTLLKEEGQKHQAELRLWWNGNDYQVSSNHVE